MKTSTWIGGLALLGAVGSLFFLWSREVELEVTPEDERYISKILEGENIEVEHGNFESELAAIRKIQESVLDIAPKNRGLSHNRAREPKDLYEERQGLCYDRSRVIEKSLRHLGFEVRHVSLYTLKDQSSVLAALSKPGVRSHAISEVKTSRGWLVVDSNDPWLSLDENGAPISVEGIKQDAEARRISWPEEALSEMSDIYQSPFTYVYGLYSRHGRFYPPYDFVPDVNWRELRANF